MEVQLQELIEQIKRDGVVAAEAEAKSIIDKAKAEADKIIADAQAQSEKILANAKNETDRMVKSSEDAIRQAGRNLLISFRESVTREIKVITEEKVVSVYSSEDFAKIIVKTVEAWATNPDAEDITVILNDIDLQNLEKVLMAEIKEKISKGVTLKANNNFDGGFRIAINNGSVYYDYSAEAVVDMLSNYLSPRVTNLLKEA